MITMIQTRNHYQPLLEPHDIFLYVNSTNLWKEKHVMENGCPTGGGILSQKCGALAEKTNVSTIAEGFPLN